MRLQEVLNKFTNTVFLSSVNGLCGEMPFHEYENKSTINQRINMV